MLAPEIKSPKIRNSNNSVIATAATLYAPFTGCNKESLLCFVGALCHTVPVHPSQAGNKLQNLSDKELQVVEKLSQGIVNKMLHGPMSALRQPDGPDEKKQTLKILKDMFKLEKL